MVYDPRLSVQERAALEELGCVNIQHNEVTKCSPSCTDVFIYIYHIIVMPEAGAQRHALLHAPLWKSHVQQSAMGQLVTREPFKGGYNWKQFSEL